MAPARGTTRVQAKPPIRTSPYPMTSLLVRVWCLWCVLTALHTAHVLYPMQNQRGRRSASTTQQRKGANGGQSSALEAFRPMLATACAWTGYHIIPYPVTLQICAILSVLVWFRHEIGSVLDDLGFESAARFCSEQYAAQQDHAVDISDLPPLEEDVDDSVVVTRRPQRLQTRATAAPHVDTARSSPSPVPQRPSTPHTPLPRDWLVFHPALGLVTKAEM